MTPSEPALIKRYRAHIENVLKSLFVSAKFASGVGTLSPSFKVVESWKKGLWMT